MTDGSGAVHLLVTTIHRPNAVLRALARGAEEAGWRFLVIGDAKSPSDFVLEGCGYFDLEAQRATGLRYATLCPTGHYARKNVGYLLAARAGASCVIETDDDNLPAAGFFDARQRSLRARSVDANGWVNVYRYFTSARVWPRGLPLDAIAEDPPPAGELREVTSPIHQGLANDSPDVDAVHRLVLAEPVRFDSAPPVALPSGAWCPFNSQNTTWWPEAFPLLYLPAHCSFRMTDVWRSLVAQRVAWANGWPIVFHAATVRQERNPHDLMRDFADEVPGYLHNRALAEALARLELEPGLVRLGVNMERCYRVLVERGWVGAAELDLLSAWLEDLDAGPSA